MSQDLSVVAGDDMGWKVEVALILFLQSLDLEGETAADRIGDKVYSRLFEDGDGMLFPAIMVSEEGLSESKEQQDDVNEVWVYPFWVTIVDKVGARRHARKRQYKRWRGKIMKALDRKIAAVTAMKTTEPAIWNVEVDPSQIFARDQEFNHVFSKLQVRIFTKKRKAGT